MNVYDFITQEELDEAPEDPSLAFTHLVRNAQLRLAEYVKEANQADDSYMRSEAQHSFMNVSVALAKAYNIEPFASIDVPMYKDFGYQDHEKIRFAVMFMVSNKPSMRLNLLTRSERGY